MHQLYTNKTTYINDLDKQSGINTLQLLLYVYIITQSKEIFKNYKYNEDSAKGVIKIIKG